MIPPKCKIRLKRSFYSLILTEEHIINIITGAFGRTDNTYNVAPKTINTTYPYDFQSVKCKTSWFVLERDKPLESDNDRFTPHA